MPSSGLSLSRDQFITKMITKPYNPRPVGLSTLNCSAFFRVQLVTLSGTSSLDMTYKKNYQTILPAARYTTSSVGEAGPPTSPLHPYFSSTPYAFLTKSAFLASGERIAGGREEFVNKGEKDEITTNRKFVKRVDKGCKGPVFLVILHPLRLTWPQMILTD